VETLLLGDEDGLAQAAGELGVHHSSRVERNPNGVPLVSSMLRLAREAGSSPLLCIINADIILTSDFVAAAKQIASLDSARSASSKPGALSAFVLLARRWDLDVPEPLDFAEGWQERLREAVRARGTLHRPTGSDFFLFPRDCYVDVPDFTIGRAGWDNWMIYKARTEGWPVIDGTPSMTIVHQSHDYRHLPGARPHYDHPETKLNTQLAGGQAATRYTLLDATRIFAGGRLQRPPLTPQRFLRGVELLLRRLLFFLPEDLLESVVRPRRWNKRLKRLLGK
ncbi:MAG TPA: hypothetical protein VF784_05630, partial [Anaerolineales bacterium]